jgi:thymidylate synthase
MSKLDNNFLALCHVIIDRGQEYEDKRRSVKRLQIPSYTFRHSFADGFPILSIKKVPIESIIGELIWFLRGDNDIAYLNENKITIWNDDAYNWYVKHHKHNYPIDEEEDGHYVENEDGSFRMFTLEEFKVIGKGSVGQNYSRQWRAFNGHTDQIMDIIRDMKKNIMGSRLKVNAWNPSETDMTALPPCHSEFQIIGVPLRLSQRINIAIEKGLTTKTAHLSESDWVK